MTGRSDAAAIERQLTEPAGRHRRLVESGVPAGDTHAPVRRRDSLCRRALALADMAAAAVALTLGVVVLGGDRVTLALAAAILLVVLVVLVVLVSKVAGLYDRDEHLLATL